MLPEQVVPLKPVPSQLQVKDPTSLEHVPPFSHGLPVEHSSMSPDKIEKSTLFVHIYLFVLTWPTGTSLYLICGEKNGFICSYDNYNV